MNFIECLFDKAKSPCKIILVSRWARDEFFEGIKMTGHLLGTITVQKSCLHTVHECLCECGVARRNEYDYTSFDNDGSTKHRWVIPDGLDVAYVRFVLTREFLPGELVSFTATDIQSGIRSGTQSA